MALFSSKSTCSVIIAISIISLASICVYRIQKTATGNIVQLATNIQSRHPRLIPSLEDYQDDIFHLQGVENPSKLATPASTPTPFTQTITEQNNIKATWSPVIGVAELTKTSSAIHTTKPRHKESEMLASTQVRSGWVTRKKLQASDLPLIPGNIPNGFDHPFHNMIDSFDEKGLNDEAE
ncbi:uncharacterized protein N7503_009838 [Penicillium pulvis]|uniref:uncharacterized protein n=1 Tax=Penicillium pulvis TaxID=1562058 RepID=UPI002548CB48|nr:uncharacterized protein N7503_009838 [Penicillium pulvis]KAJ5784626.1 hypothetical protein N7503_009838 [Penicillium pulvis]